MSPGAAPPKSAAGSTPTPGGQALELTVMAIFDVPQRFSRKWVAEKVPRMDSTEFHAMFHEAAARGWNEDELRQLARMWAADRTDSAPHTGQ